jgi:hypothetical protein
MDTWTNLAITVFLELLRDNKRAVKFFPAIAKVYHKIHLMAQLDQRLQAEIEHQEAKSGGR